MALKKNIFKNSLIPDADLKGNGEAKKHFSLDERQEKKIISTSSEYNLNIQLEMLSPLERKVIEFIRSKTSGTPQDPHNAPQMVLVPSDELLEASGVSRYSLNNVIWKLKEKNILEIIKTKKGPGGSRLFKVNQWIRKPSTG